MNEKADPYRDAAESPETLGALQLIKDAKRCLDEFDFDGYLEKCVEFGTLMVTGRINLENQPELRNKWDKEVLSMYYFKTVEKIINECDEKIKLEGSADSEWVRQMYALALESIETCKAKKDVKAEESGLASALEKMLNSSNLGNAANLKLEETE